MKSALLIPILFLFSIPIFAQEENLDKMLDEFLFGKNAQDSLLESNGINDMDLTGILNSLYNYRYIYVRSEFENKTFFSGQDLGINQYNITGQVNYQGPKGLTVGVAGIMYSKFEPQYNTTILSLGYNKHVSGIKGLNFRASYSRYIFPKVDSVKSSDFNSSANIGLTYQWKHLGSSADFSTLLGNKKSVQINWDIFADITIAKFGLSYKLSLEPEVAFYLGNETVVINQFITLPKISGELSSQKRNFGLMNTIIKLPVSVTLGNIDIVAGYNFNFPTTTGNNSTALKTSFFNVSVGYLFGF
jgi:hypothetical protein